jgi:hypothetical protein
MKKVITLIPVFLIAAFASAQVAVTFQVDVTNYIAGGATIDGSGMRVAGNFSARQGTVGGSPMPDWSPTTSACAMTAQANNIWQTVVNFPNNSVGQQLQYIFVNGNFGQQEGLSANNQFVSEGCGMLATVLGSPVTIRTLLIPQMATTKLFCFDSCYSCAGSGVGLNESAIANLTVAPNPSNDVVTFSFGTLSNAAEITLFDLSGKVVASRKVNTTAFNVIDFSIANLTSGSYMYQIEAEGSVVAGKLMKK